MLKANRRHACFCLLAVVSVAFIDPAARAIGEAPAEGADEASVATAAVLAEESRYRQILAAKPDDEVSYQALVALTEARSLPVSSTAARATQRHLPAAFRSHETERFLILTDADQRAVLEHGVWLERAYEEFNRFAAGCGLRPLPLEHKLVCVLFRSDDAYQSFARANDGMSDRQITGYYSPRNDRIVFALPDHTGSADGGARDDRAEEAAAPELKTVLRFDAERSQRRGVMDGGWFSNELGNDAAAKCVHETIHQLMFHTRLMKRDVQYPLWICEGLSTAFETFAPAQAFGPDRDYAPRRVAFQNLLRRDELLPLRELAAIARLPRVDDPEWEGGRGGRAIYPQSYALVTWLCHMRPEALRRYLDLMRIEPAGRLSATRHLELFEMAFGDAGALERAWLADERAAIE